MRINSYTIKKGLEKKAPLILLITSIGGFIGGTISAVASTPKAMRLIEEKKEELGVEKLKPIEAVQTAWKCYIPAATIIGASIGCSIGSYKTGAMQRVALSNAVSVLESSMQEIKDKTKEVIGPEKQQKIFDKIAEEKVRKEPPKETNIYVTGNGEHLCLDTISGEYFKSDIDKIRAGIEQVNNIIFRDGYASYNDLRYEWRLNPSGMGDDIGWKYEKGGLLVTYSSALTDNQVPVLVINYFTEPIRNYDK